MKMRVSDYGDRVDEFSLSSDERPKNMYEYWVTGSGAFPLDMLRHDSCWPASGADAAKMEYGHDGFSLYERGKRSVKMRSYRAPTIARWSSFTWSVGKRAIVE